MERNKEMTIALVAVLILMAAFVIGCSLAQVPTAQQTPILSTFGGIVSVLVAQLWGTRIQNQKLEKQDQALSRIESTVNRVASDTPALSGVPWWTIEGIVLSTSLRPDGALIVRLRSSGVSDGGIVIVIADEEKSEVTWNDGLPAKVSSDILAQKLKETKTVRVKAEQLPERFGAALKAEFSPDNSED
jgi:hypothetical protein